MNYEEIGKRIQHFRIKSGYTQTELAKHLACSSKHLGNIERGSSRPSLECLQDISNVLNISLDSLISNKTSKNNLEHHSELVNLFDHFLQEQQLEIARIRHLISEYL